MQKTNLCFVLGTRPEIIKLSPLIDECRTRGIDFFVIHTGQHFDYAMDGVFFEELGLPKPEYNLAVHGLPYRQQVGKMVAGIETILDERSPTAVIVQGDTTSVVAGGLAAASRGVPIAHVEAGLRSGDLRMLEEVHRILVDHIAQYLFAPTAESAAYLLSEDIEPSKVMVVGNTIVDAINRNLSLVGKKTSVLKTLHAEPGRYVLATIHRAENVDSQERLSQIMEGLARVAEAYTMPVFLPIHPRTAAAIKRYNIALSPSVQVVDPLGYFDFLNLMKSARLIVTDSGGIQEEASILHVPCITARDTTERPETVSAGVNRLAGTDARAIADAANDFKEPPSQWPPLYGDGTAAKQILDILTAAV